MLRIVPFSFESLPLENCDIGLDDLKITAHQQGQQDDAGTVFFNRLDGT